MQRMVILFVLTAMAIGLPIACAHSYAPIMQQKFGPLHESIKLLIVDEQFNAHLVWNETAHQLNETLILLKQSLAALSHQNPLQHLKKLNEITKNPNFYHCYKDYEREIALFNREFITKYDVCKQALNIAASHLEDKTFDEINFLRNAPLAIALVPSICKVSDLKYAHKNHAGIVLCIVSRLGHIDQRLLKASELMLDIVSEIAVSTADIDAYSCHDYNDLKLQFDEIFLVISGCVDKS